MTSGSCPNFPALAHYLSGDLAPPAFTQVEAHITGCADCQNQVDELSRTTPGGRFSPTQIAGGDLPDGQVPVRKDRQTIPPGTVVGEYEIVRRIGIGGMGEVYEAVHPLIGKRAAVKVIGHHLCRDAEAVRRFMVEARAANEIGSKRIVDVFSFGTLDDGRSYQIMELLEGVSLGERLAEGPMAPEAALSVFEQIAGAVEAAHAREVVHRDLKPDNVFLVRGERGPEVKLLDFGIAKLVGHQPTDASVTAAGVVLGTPLYMSPEQIRGESVGRATDVYALGVLLFEMLTGKPPFPQQTSADVMAAHLQTPPPRLEVQLPIAPIRLSDLLARMLDKSASARPSAAEVRSEVRAIEWGRSDGPAPVAGNKRRSRGPAIAVAAVALAATTSFVLWKAGGATPQPEATKASSAEVQHRQSPSPSPKTTRAAAREPRPRPLPSPPPIPAPLAAPPVAPPAEERRADESPQERKQRRRKEARSRRRAEKDKPAVVAPEPAASRPPPQEDLATPPRPPIDTDAPIADPFAP